MSGICGLVLRHPLSASDEMSFPSMLEALDGGRQERRWGVTVGSALLGVAGFGKNMAALTQMSVHGHPCGLAVFGSLYRQPQYLNGLGQGRDIASLLLERYLNEGIDFLAHLHGDFAIAIWDGREGRLHVATDRFRVHPIFYVIERETFTFASRMRGLRGREAAAHGAIDPRAILDVVALSAIATPRTILTGVRKLSPGEVLTWQDGQVRLNPYWRINFLRPSPQEEPELAMQLRAHVSDAVSSRSLVDAGEKRLGTFLSGGVDSSTVTGLLKALSQSEVHSFSIGFGEQRFDELEYARIAARHFGVPHHEYVVTAQDAREAIPVFLDAFDEPFANASAIPTYFCAKFAKEHNVDILYAGDGGDELFAGNERYSEQRLFEYYDQVPPWLRNALGLTIQRLARMTGLPLFEKGARYIRRASIPLPQRLTTYGFFNVVSLQDLFEPDFLRSLGNAPNPYEPIERHYLQAPADTELDRQLYLDLKFAISDNDLFKVTRMTEAAGVIVRFPFLDHRLAEFATEVPARMKMRGRKLRTFFKDAYSDFLPEAIRTKTKHGFGLPIPIWLRTDPYLHELMRELVLSPRSLQRGYFRKSMLEELIRRHQSDATSFYGAILWNLMILELWHRTHWDARP